MARRKKPLNETPHERETRQQLDAIADKASRSEKVSWNRKMDNMVKLLSKIGPIEKKRTAVLAKINEAQYELRDLDEEWIKMYDEVAILRNEMVEECVHPFDQLVHKQDHIECKFCYRRFWFRNFNNGTENT